MARSAKLVAIDHILVRRIYLIPPVQFTDPDITPTVTFSMKAVPEPSTLVLAGLAGVGLCCSHGGSENVYADTRSGVTPSGQIMGRGVVFRPGQNSRFFPRARFAPTCCYGIPVQLHGVCASCTGGIFRVWRQRCNPSGGGILPPCCGRVPQPKTCAHVGACYRLIPMPFNESLPDRLAIRVVMPAWSCCRHIWFAVGCYHGFIQRYCG